jgi:stalled ribosome alternative rescue factor ArfA
MDIEVRKFKPREGDVLHRSWRVGNRLKKTDLEPYAIANIEAYAQSFKKYIYDNAIKAMMSYSVFMNKEEAHKACGGEDPLVAETYKFAVKHYNQLLVL